MEVKQGTFTPLVYSTMGGMAPEAKTIQSIWQRESQTNGVNYTQKQSATLGAE